MDDHHTPDTPGAAPDPGTLAAAVPLRARHDGWTPEKQHDFIAALAESGCVAEACRAVGMTTHSAYRLRARPDASVFRQSWDVALDFAIRRLSDAAFGRALNGVATPVFFQGEQIGERRRFDERLTMFLLRYRDPVRYGAWLDGMEARRHPDGAAIVLAHALNSVFDAAHGVDPEPEPEPDSGDPGQPDTAGPRAIAEGPWLDRTAADEEPYKHLPDDTRELFSSIRAQRRRMEEAAADPDRHDWREPLTVHRPRNGKGAS